jgi:uroporphyrinogen-III synthase
MLGKPKVALFRAREDAAGSARRLRKLGFSVASLPAIEINVLPVESKRARYDAVVATSDKAFLADTSRDLMSPLYVVGARTGLAAEARGWRLAAPPAADAAHLIDTLAARLKPGAHVLYLAGRDRKHAIEAALGRTYRLETVEAYAAEARASWPPAELRALDACVVALHYSRRSATLALQLAKDAGVEARFLALAHVCLSRDVAEPLIAAGAARVAIAHEPNEAALIRALSQEAHEFASRRSFRI